MAKTTINRSFAANVQATAGFEDFPVGKFEVINVTEKTNRNGLRDAYITGIVTPEAQEPVAVVASLGGIKRVQKWEDYFENGDTNEEMKLKDGVLMGRGDGQYYLSLQ